MDALQAAKKHENFIARAEATGRWWESPWWEDPDCEIPFTVSREATSRGADVIRRHFDDAWYRELAARPRPSLLFPKLCLERSTAALEFIAGFGAQLERLEATTNLHRPLKVMRQAYGDSALFELEAADAFVENGFKVSFPPERPSKSPDVMAEKDGETLFIECKRLGDEQWEDWESALMHELTRGLPSEHKGKEIIVEVSINRRLSEVRFGGQADEAVNRAIFSTIKESILSNIEGALAEKDAPFEFLLPDIAKVRISPKAEGLYSSVGGMERSVPGMFRRIFQNGIFRALPQLPKGRPGAILVFSKHAPPPGFFRLLFDAAARVDRERFQDLTAVMICTLQTWFERPKPWLFQNHYVRHASATSLVCEALATGFGAQRA